MFAFTTLAIRGYQDRPLNNTFVRQESPAYHIAVIFPGRAYGVDAPLLYYTRAVLLALGADVLGVETNYHRTPGFDKASAGEQAAWLASDAEAALDAALAQHTYSRITLAGKSLGTYAVGHLVASDARIANAACLWLTPLLGDERLRRQIIRGGQRGLFVVGTADPLYHPAGLDEILSAVPGSKFLVDGADHSLELPGDVQGSVRVLERFVAAVKDFLADG